MFEQEQLLEQLGEPYTIRVVDRLHRFAYMPPAILESLAKDALSEHWGNGNYVLSKYLAVHIAWSIEQGRYTHNDQQFYVTAGHLQTRYGTPLYLVFAANLTSTTIPWRLITAGSQISAPVLPTPPEIPASPGIPVGAEIVMMHDHILGDNTARVPFLNQTPPVAQMCAVSGAIQWSINRNLQLPYWYFGKMNYLVPLYLQSRENITLAPDLIAPVQVNPDSLLVRTVLEPTMPYANARVSVKRHDQLPAWMLSSWSAAAATVPVSQIEDPENRSENNENS
jgi:hypothetical protein